MPRPSALAAPRPRGALALLLAPVPALLAVAVLLLPGCGDGGDAAPAATGGPLAGPALDPDSDIRLNFVWFSRLQGYAEGVPCNPASPTPLASAGLLADELEAEGQGVLVACIGDTLVQAISLTMTRATMIGTLAKADVQMDAMAEAGVDVYVPSHGDFFDGVLPVLDRARERGLRVVVTNLVAEGRDDVLPYFIYEHGGARVGVLGVIPRQAGGNQPGSQKNDDSISFQNPVRRARQVSTELMASGEVNAVVCLSALAAEQNRTLAELPNVHYVMGGIDKGEAPGKAIRFGESSLLVERNGGRSIGHTTMRVKGGSWALGDISERHALPEQLAREQETLDAYARAYGTDDPEVLAPLVIPENPENFFLKLELMEENKIFLEQAADWPDSFLDHRHYEPTPVADDDPVKQLLSTQGAALHAAVDAMTRPPEALAEDAALPAPDDCRQCHPDQYDWWADTGHASAYELLVGVGREQDSSCLVCHAVGFGMPGGFRDPRVGAPFGGISCYNCHEVRPVHVGNKKLVVDPLYVHAERVDMMCETCHQNYRSPGFDREAGLDAIACPPMRPDEPALIAARTEALDIIERQRRRGETTDWDVFLEGRALVGLGRLDEGLAKVREYAKGVDDWPDMVYSCVLYLEEHGDSHGALEVLRDALKTDTSNLVLNLAYLEQLTQASDPTARDLDLALSHARLMAPGDQKLMSQLIPAYILQVDLMMAKGGMRDEAKDLIMRVAREFEGVDEIGACLARHGLLLNR